MNTKGIGLPQVPSPAQAAIVGWNVLWFVRTSPSDQLALCVATCSGSALNNFTESLQIDPELVGLN